MTPLHTGQYSFAGEKKINCEERRRKSSLTLESSPFVCPIFVDVFFPHLRGGWQWVGRVFLRQIGFLALDFSLCFSSWSLPSDNFLNNRCSWLVWPSLRFSLFNIVLLFYVPRRIFFLLSEHWKPFVELLRNVHRKMRFTVQIYSFWNFLSGRAITTKRSRSRLHRTLRYLLPALLF